VSSRRNAGFSLPEVLVALTLLSSCLASSALMLVQALRYERDAACRSTAARLAGTLAEQLRLLQRSDGRPLQAVAAPGEGASCSVQADCVVESEAARTLAAWQEEASASLPVGSSSRVELLSATPLAYRIRVDWPGAVQSAGATLVLAVEP
jgi:prepilin-type N-terminal cleavage/methylation domain-containing protein